MKQNQLLSELECREARETYGPDAFIANIDSADDGYFLKLTAQPDGTFTVYNARNKNEKTYTK